MSLERKKKQCLHGSMVVIEGCGVVIQGDPGVGKTELVMQLLSRGHGFVADDYIEAHDKASCLWGCSAAHYRYQLCLKDVGLLKVAECFPDVRCYPEYKLAMMFKLQSNAQRYHQKDDPRLPVVSSEMVQGYLIPCYHLEAWKGRPLPALLEWMVRTYCVSFKRGKAS